MTKRHLSSENNDGLGSIAIKDLNFVERINYGFIDNSNYSVIPNENMLVPLKYVLDPSKAERVFDFVADAYSNMRLNFTVACQKGLILQEGAAFGEFKATKTYKSPMIRYGEYIDKIFTGYTKYINRIVDISNITSYKEYVNYFIKYIYSEGFNNPITMTRFQKSILSSITDTGLAIEYFKMPVDADQRKIDEIIDHPSFPYFENLCYNMGFSILKNRPNILLFDISSPAAKPYLSRLGLFNLDIIFEKRFNKTHMHDMNILLNYININYNNFVLTNPRTKVVTVRCRKTVSHMIYRQQVAIDTIPYNDNQLLSIYSNIRNVEEGQPFTKEKVNEITRKAIFFHKRFDKERAMGYISSEYKDQVWNKTSGYDDHINKLRGRTTDTSGRRTRGEGSSTSGGGSSSGY